MGFILTMMNPSIYVHGKVHANLLPIKTINNEWYSCVLFIFGFRDEGCPELDLPEQLLRINDLLLESDNQT